MSSLHNRARSRSAAATGAASDPQAGVALVMAMIFSILLYILVADLVVSSRMVRATGENDALLARMNTQMLYELGEAEDKLLADMASATAEGEGGAMPGGGGGALGEALGSAPAGGEGLGEEGAEEDPTTKCDSSRDAWFEPSGHPDNDLTTYVWIEDENRKFNLLSIWSPDEEFAQESREGLVRLIDTLREDTEWDVPSTDASLIVQEIVEWARRPATEAMPVPPLKSMKEDDRDFAIPLHLDELMMLPSVDAELFFDKAIDQKVYLGLESVLTIWTAQIQDPGNPEKLARQRAIAEARGQRAPQGEGEGEGAGAEGGNEAGNEAGAEGDEPQQPEGIGIKVNVNTATRPVLRALFPEDMVPDRVIDGIIRYRNEIDEEATDEASDQQAEETSDFGDMMLGDQPLKRFFETLEDLEQVEEFAQIPDPEVKSKIMTRLTVNSDVFSIHLASLYKRNENENKRIFLLRRARSIVRRIDDGEEGQILPIVPYEERIGLRVQPVDMQDEILQDWTVTYMDMDQFSQEERAWNPFLIDFYLPPDVRENFYSNR
jgi:hypothetical protein